MKRCINKWCKMNRTSDPQLPGDVQVAPLRSLDDFLMENSRFQIPNFKEPDKWANRILQNLLYYQTNYFASALIVFLIVGVLHPGKMLLGMLAMSVALGLFFYVTNSKSSAVKFKKDHPIFSVVVVLSAGYFIVYMLGSVLVFLVGILLPLLVIFLHASMRLRNIKNKLSNKFEALGMKKSPMGIFLQAFGLEPDLFS